MSSVLVTGASSGIGRACVETLASAGFHVFAGVRSSVDAEKLRSELGEHVSPLLLEATSERDVEAARDVVIERNGAGELAGIVHCAGIALAGPLECIRPEMLLHQLHVNVVGPFALSRALLPLLRTSRGRLVFISSMSGRLALPFMGPYAASKFALEALIDAFRVELAPWGIEVVSVQPGVVSTPIWTKSLAAMLQLDGADRYERRLKVMRDAAHAAQTHAGLDPRSVASMALHALTCARPRTRYPVGRFTSAMALAVRLLPDRMRDAAIRRFRFGETWRRGASS
jgi:NAD(P)-dependent dehydrogenase (short-subunit alcohol dehydrogenase family)